MVMMDKNMDAKQKKKMLEEIDVKGVKWTISMNSLIGLDRTGFHDPG